MERINYNKLYRLQDEALNLVFAEDTEFYLTGGTSGQTHDFFSEFSVLLPVGEQRPVCVNEKC